MQLKSTLRVHITPVRMAIIEITSEKNSVYAISQQIYQVIKSLWTKRRKK